MNIRRCQSSGQTEGESTWRLETDRAAGGAALGLQLAMELTGVVAAIPPAVLQIGHEWLE